MNLNFIWTKGEFKYTNYLAVMTALRTQHFQHAILWTYPGKISWYFELLQHFGLEIRATLSEKTFPALANKSEDFQGAVLKDYWMWELGYEHGGIFMDLDTISLQDISNMLGDKEMVVPLDIENEGDCEHPFNNAIVIIKKGSTVAAELSLECECRLVLNDIKWGDTGPALLTNIIKANKDKVVVAPFRQLGGYGGHECQEIYERDGLLISEAKIIHCFAIASGEDFANITPDYIKVQMPVPYCTYVKSVLPSYLWDIFDIKDWCKNRGQHYQPMFEYLSTHYVKNIMEIGTYNGDNAIGMIETSLLNNLDISYYGFDVFRAHDEEFQEREVTTGYNVPPDSGLVFNYISKATGATVELHKGDSKVTLPIAVEKLPKMDFIYIDGGHSLETIRSDWKYAKRLMHKNTVVFFDDYFLGRDDIGCKFMIDEWQDKYDVQVVGQIDNYEKFQIQLLKVTLRNKRKISKIVPTISKSDHFRFHLLGLAHVPTSKLIYSCAYTQKIVNLSKMLMDMGHEVYLYCGEGSDIPATERITVVTDAQRKAVYGNYDWTKDFFKHDPKDAVHEEFNRNAIKEINKRKHAQDFLLCPMGNYQKPIADAVKLETVEPGIGYYGVFSKYRVFESYAWMHHIYGELKQEDGSWYDAVIPNSYDPEDFPFDPNTQKQDYFVFIGRLVGRKGLEIAVEATERLGTKLIVAGQGNLKDVEGMDFSNYKHVTHIGTVTPEGRAKLISEARGVFVPTYYIGPFEGVAVESQLLGTPVITTDWGVFSETVLHGKTGFRCRTMEEFVWAGKNISNLNPQDCRDFAMSNYSIHRVKYMYEEYFRRVYELWSDGWYAENPKRNELDWLKRYNL
jgi:glycosyltransferase involved in cell wall biosynthesis